MKKKSILICMTHLGWESCWVALWWIFLDDLYSFSHCLPLKPRLHQLLIHSCFHPPNSKYLLFVCSGFADFHISLYDCPVCKVVFPNGLFGRPSLHYYSASQLGRLLVPIFAPSSSSSSYYSSSQFRHLLPSHINTWVWNFWRKKRPWGSRVDAGYFLGSEQMNDSECLKKEDA